MRLLLVQVTEHVLALRQLYLHHRLVSGSSFYVDAALCVFVERFVNDSEGVLVQSAGPEGISADREFRLTDLGFRDRAGSIRVYSIAFKLVREGCNLCGVAHNKRLQLEGLRVGYVEVVAA